MTSVKHPTVSVIMPVYNVRHYVADAIRSVLAQTLDDFELIIVDDGSTDDSLALCHDFEDKRIRIIAQSNRGLAGARNTGINAALGEFIALLDSDDLWAPEKLALHVVHLQCNPQLGVSTAAARLINAKGMALHITQRPKRGRVLAEDVFCGRVILNGSAPVFRRAALEQAALPADAEGRIWYFDETLRRSEDVECWTRVALRTKYRFGTLRQVLTFYRINSGGLSADVIRQLNSWGDVRDRLAQMAPTFIALHEARARAREMRYLARRCVQMRERALGWSLMVEAVRMHPTLLLREPVKTGTTLAACGLMRLLPEAEFGRLLNTLRPALSRGAAA